jgi:hypothetical protein
VLASAFPDRGASAFTGEEKTLIIIQTGKLWKSHHINL